MNRLRLLQFVGSLVCVLTYVACVDIRTIDNCRIRSEDPVIQSLKESVIYTFEIEIYNQSNPLKTDVSLTYKPWKWYRTTSEHGKTLLTLSFNYDVLSLYILAIGVQNVKVKIVDNPEGCFNNLTAKERVELLRDKVFDNFKRKRSLQDVSEFAEVENTEDMPPMTYVCNGIVRETNGWAEFANQCCARDSNGNIKCSNQEDNGWIAVLYICIGLVKLMLFLFCPLVVPSNMYSAAYVASEYVVKLSKALRLKLFLSESAVTSIRYKSRLTIDAISDWHQFKHCLEHLPKEEICYVKISELKIKVKGKRIIPANEPPTGLLRTFYDNLIRCKIRRLEPFKDCCNGSIFGSLQPYFKHEYHWENLTLLFIKIVCLFIVPVPFYIRVFIYFRFEEDELNSRKFIVNKLGFQQAFNPFRMNFIQYLSPTHVLFLAAYTFYILAGVVVGFAKDNFRDTVKSVVRSAFHDMENISRTKVMQVVMQLLIWPFRKLGLLALVTCPIIGIITAPLWVTIFVIYAFPTFYLAHRLVYHIQRRLSGEPGISESDKSFGISNNHIHKLHEKFINIDKRVHNARMKFIAEEKQSPCTAGHGRLADIRRLVIKVISSLFCLAVLLSCVLLFVEAVGVMVEVLVFTMMGIIVNAGSTLKYVSMALLVIVYMHNCYDNVYDNYLEFNYSVMDDIMQRVEDLKKVASLPSSVQENVAFQVKPVEAVNEIITTLNLTKREPTWKIGHLLLFLDSYDTPRIPLNLFKKLCEIRVHGAPGPVYINLLIATGKFSIILVFLFFVMIVVMAFGSANQMSSTNQTLATLAGGFVPMLLKNVLSSKGTKLNLSTLSFKGQIDEIVSAYKQNWPISDVVVDKYDPLDETEKDYEKQEEAEKMESTLNDCNKKWKDNNGGHDIFLDKINDRTHKHENNANAAANNTLYVSRRFEDSVEDLRTHDNDSELGSSSHTDDNYVDIFIDLSVDEAFSPWQWLYGSHESLGKSDVSETMFSEVKIDPRMPYPTTIS